MLPSRLQVLSALLVLLLAAGRCTAAAFIRGVDARSALEPRARSDTAAVTEYRALARESRSHHGMEGHLKDPRHKEKFLRHLTGPLYFSPKCRKDFIKLYHSTRECTLPAYYKRCARLLSRLASSPRCAER